MLVQSMGRPIALSSSGLHCTSWQCAGQDMSGTRVQRIRYNIHRPQPFFRSDLKFFRGYGCASLWYDRLWNPLRQETVVNLRVQCLQGGGLFSLWKQVHKGLEVVELLGSSPRSSSHPRTAARMRNSQKVEEGTKQGAECERKSPANIYS